MDTTVTVITIAHNGPYHLSVEDREVTPDDWKLWIRDIIGAETQSCQNDGIVKVIDAGSSPYIRSDHGACKHCPHWPRAEA